jgi:histidyl-tRNA synthetase
MFRHEKKQKGRWRQFYQIGAEVLGSDHPAIESEAIEMVLALLESLQISTKLLINSVGCPACRPLYIRVLRAKLEEIRAQLCEDCRRRTETNPLRVLDCKVEDCQPHIAMLPMISDHLCSGCSDHFARFRGFLDDAGISYQALPRLVRGLDYYVRTAFEIVSGDLGAQNALVGGGRYDGLSEVLGGPPIHGFGFAMGLDRLVMLLPKAIADQATSHADLFSVYRGESAFRNALSVASRLRREGHFCQLDFSSGSFKSQFRLANKVNARHVLIIGEEELATGRYAIKRLEDSHQWNVSLAELLDYLTSLQIPQSI